MAGLPKKSGPRRQFTVEEHKRRGTYRPDRMGHFDDALTLDIPAKPKGRIKAAARSQSRWCHCDADELAVAEGYRFNEALAAHVVEFFLTFLRHSKGQWAGQPFELTAWQREKLIYPLFGWVDEYGHRRFRRTYIEIPKKNYKSTTAAGIGLYMLVADEEPGAEVYSLGADQDQASIVHREAIHMIEASPELASELNINRTTRVISFDRSKSYYRALSASPRGKHGINIHCAVADELHEWTSKTGTQGRELWDAIKYGFRARRQPMLFVITNAGDDIQSVCYEQREKALRVMDGSLYDPRYFALVMHVDEEEAQAEIDAVAGGDYSLPVAIRCNPALAEGMLRTEDLVADIKDSIDTPSERPNLLRLSYGVWVTATKPWLDQSRWAACAEEFEEADLIGLGCCGGLDLAKTRDMTSLALIFPDDERDGHWQLLTWFWLPEDTALSRKNPNHLQYQQWADGGYITLTPGGVCDYAFLKKQFIELTERFDIREFAFDPYNAEQITQEMEEQTGVPRLLFPQTIKNFAGPTGEFERIVVDGRLHHNNHPVLNWQASHVQVRVDANSNKRPVKPDDHDHRKIDGIVASIMALGCAMQCDDLRTEVEYAGFRTL